MGNRLTGDRKKGADYTRNRLQTQTTPPRSAQWQSLPAAAGLAEFFWAVQKNIDNAGKGSYFNACEL
ncbi:hypothetical protein [Pseudomonas shirazensis]|uniref:hypothetical protein n=1 Tax=Pseudomonas shirazensis TaxID=2745494 RepID=UPI003D278615